MVKNCEAFEEDTWQQFTVGDENLRVFRGVKPCSRCKVGILNFNFFVHLLRRKSNYTFNFFFSCQITRTNQETAEVGPEPFQVETTLHNCL